MVGLSFQRGSRLVRLLWLYRDVKGFGELYLCLCKDDSGIALATSTFPAYTMRA